MPMLFRKSTFFLETLMVTVSVPLAGAIVKQTKETALLGDSLTISRIDQYEYMFLRVRGLNNASPFVLEYNIGSGVPPESPSANTRILS